MTTQDHDEPTTSSRRTLFKLAGVGLAGVTGAALLESPAQAAAGLVLGTTNIESAVTSLSASGAGSADASALELVANGGGYGLEATGGNSISGGQAGSSVYAAGGQGGGDGLGAVGGIATSGTAGRGVIASGGEGFAANGGLGAQVEGGESDLLAGGGATIEGGAGGTGGGVGLEVRGGNVKANGSGSGGNAIVASGGMAAGTGFSGMAMDATGGAAGGGSTVAGAGVRASGGQAAAGGNGGVGVIAIGGYPSGAPLLLSNGGGEGPPTIGDHQRGEIWLDQSCTPWICVADGKPGTWTRVLAVPQTGGAGATHLLVHPVRMFSGKVAAKKSATVQVTGHKVSGLEIPAGATGVIGTLSVSATGTHGYLSTFASTPHASTPLTTSLSWKGKDQSTSAQVTIALTAAGKCVIANGFKGGSTTAHVTFDVVGYLA